ncbi:MAG: hypothetical protein SX243_09790 [Acidobacteriota bacterium]|nr:hypothetical protein [Acidobacteriota bacterium]
MHRFLKNSSSASIPSALAGGWKLAALGAALALGWVALVPTSQISAVTRGMQLLLSLPAVWALAGLVVTVAAWDRWLRGSSRESNLFALHQSEPPSRAEPASKPGRREKRRPSRTPKTSSRAPKARPRATPPRCPDCGTPSLLVDAPADSEPGLAGTEQPPDWTCPGCAATGHRSGG